MEWQTLNNYHRCISRSYCMTHNFSSTCYEEHPSSKNPTIKHFQFLSFALWAYTIWMVLTLALSPFKLTTFSSYNECAWFFLCFQFEWTWFYAKFYDAIESMSFVHFHVDYFNSNTNSPLESIVFFFLSSSSQRFYNVLKCSIKSRD